MLLLGPGEDAYELTMTYVKLPDLRPATVPANWTREPPKPPPIRTKVRPASTDSLLSEDLVERIRKIRH